MYFPVVLMSEICGFVFKTVWDVLGALAAALDLYT